MRKVAAAAGLYFLSIFAPVPITAYKDNNSKILSDNIPKDKNASCAAKKIYSYPQTEIYPSKIKQGEVEFITIKTKDSLINPYYEYNGAKSTIYRENDSIYKGYIGTTPNSKIGRHKVIIKDASNKLTDTLVFRLDPKKFYNQTLNFSNSSKNLTASEYEKEKISSALKTPSEKDYFNNPPYDTPSTGKMSTEYGAKRPYYHNGIDIAAPEGTSIKSIMPGKVLIAEAFTLNGKTVIIDHGRGFKSVYLHLSEIETKVGQVISKNQEIGKVGSTGRSTNPHLHFGIYVNGVPINPEKLLKPIEKNQCIIDRIKNSLKTAKDTSEKIIKNQPKTLKRLIK